MSTPTTTDDLTRTWVAAELAADLLLATWTQTATYRGRPSIGAFRLGAVIDAGRLVSVQLSGPMAGRP